MGGKKSLWRKKIVKTRSDAQENDDSASVISDLESDDMFSMDLSMSSVDQLTDEEDYESKETDESLAKIFKNSRDISVVFGVDLFSLDLSMSSVDHETDEEEDYLAAETNETCESRIRPD